MSPANKGNFLLLYMEATMAGLKSDDGYLKQLAFKIIDSVQILHET